jgi:uncharacterized Zn-finger protein
MRSLHPDYEWIRIPKKYVCPVATCDRSYSHHKDLKRHGLKHDQEKIKEVESEILMLNDKFRS